MTNFIFAFIFRGASHVFFGFSLSPMVIPSRADLAAPVLWPQPFLVIIPQPKNGDIIDFYWIVLDISGYYCILLDIIGYYWISLDIIGY